MGIFAQFVGCKLDSSTAASASLIDCPGHHQGANSRITMLFGDVDRFDLEVFSAPGCQIPQIGQMEGSDHFTSAVDHHNFIVWRCINFLECFKVNRGNWLRQLRSWLAVGSSGIRYADDRRYVLECCPAYANFFWKHELFLAGRRFSYKSPPNGKRDALAKNGRRLTITR